MHTLTQALETGWPEYLMEAAGLGIFMISACLFGALLEFPGSPVHQAIPSALLRRAVMGIAMGVTALLIILSPWGQQSGAHLNPATTLTFLSLGKIQPARALFYVLAQFAGGTAGVVLASIVAGPALMNPQVNFVVTQPGPLGSGVAFAAEVLISGLMMTAVLHSANSKRFSRFTPYVAATLVALFILFEAPYSGMSMNPARTFASAVVARQWVAFWIYLSAPLLGMFLAGALFERPVYCAKLHHHNHRRCLFNCHYGDLHAN